MPEANVLFVVAAVVIAALAGWVAVVMKTAKEPWARPGVVAKVDRGEDAPLVGADDKVETEEESTKGEAKADDAEKADEPEAKKEPEAKAADAEEAAEKDDEKADDDEKKDAKKA